MDLKQTQKVDPLKKQVESGVKTQGLSPMDAPDAFEPPHLDAVPVSEMHPFLQNLVKEHVEFVEQLAAFEKALHEIPEKGITKDVDKGIRDFFHYFDHHFTEHHRLEDAKLFPLLKKVLPKTADYMKGSDALSPVEVMEEDHVKAMQLAAVTFNFFGLVSRLPDPKSQLLVLDAALQQGKELVELMRIHIFREDNIIFSSAQKHLEKETLDKMMEH